MKILQKLILGLLASSCLTLAYIQPAWSVIILDLPSAVNPANTHTFSNLSDEELMQHLFEVNDFSDIIDSGLYIRDLETRYEDSFSDITVGPNGYEAVFTNANITYTGNFLCSYGYMPYSNDVKSVRVYDDELREWEIEHQGLRSQSFEFFEGEKITGRREQDGILYLSSTAIHNGVFDYNFVQSNVEPIPLGTKLYMEYAFDIASGYYLGDQIFIKQNDQFVRVFKQNFEYHTEQPLVDAVVALHEDVCGGNTHTIGIVVGQGTERERFYVVTANEESFLDPWIRDKDSEYKYYLDPEFTIECPTTEYGYIPFDSDKVIYVK